MVNLRSSPSRLPVSGVRLSSSDIRPRPSGGLGELGGNTAIEAVPADDEALMRASADLIDPVMRHHFEFSARASYLDALGVDGDRHSRRRRRSVGDIDMHAEAPLAFVEMRLQQLHAGPFHQPDHEDGRKHIGHGLELGDPDKAAAQSSSHDIGKDVLSPGLSDGFMARPFARAPRWPSRRREWRCPCPPKG